MPQIAPVQSTHIRHGMLVDLTVNTSSYYISNLYGPITYNGNNYTQLGHFLGITEIQTDLRITNSQISLSLSGIPPSNGDVNYMIVALDARLKGSQIKIYRVFFDTATGDYQPTQVYLRYSGYVNNYSLTENWDQDNKIVSNTVTLQCSSINAVTEKKYSGRRTNDQDQQRFYPGDIGMYRVIKISEKAFDFGKPYNAPSSSEAPGGGGGAIDFQPAESTGP